MSKVALAEAGLLTVDGRCRRDSAGAVEDDRQVDVLEEASRVLLGEVVRNHRGEGADEEEERQGVIDLPSRELKLGSDHTPDNGGSSEDFCRWTDESNQDMMSA